MTQRRSKSQINGSQKNQKINKKLTEKNTNIKESATYSKPSFFDNFISKYSFWTAFGLIFIIGIIAFKDFLFLKKLYFFKDIGSDTINVDYPTMIHYINMHKEGWFNTWSYYIGLGTPYYSGLPNPLNIMIYPGIVTNPLMKLIYGVDPALLRTGNLLVTLLVIGIIFYFYLRTLDFNIYSSIYGTVVFTFIGFSIMASSWGHEWDVYIGACLLFAFEQFFRKGRWYFIPIALIQFGGNLFYIYLYGVFLFLYFLLRYIEEKEWNTKEFILMSFQLCGLALLGIAMNSINTISEMFTMIFSPRVSGNSTFFSQLSSGTAVVADHSLERATAILRLFSTDILGNGSNFKGWYNYLEAPAFYCGLSTLLLIPQLFMHLSRKSKIIYGSFLAIWVLIVLVPFTRYTLLLYVGDYYKRGIDFFVVFTFILFAIKALNSIEKTLKINWIVLAISFVTLLVLLFYPYFPSHTSIIDKEIRNWVVLLLIIYGFLIYFFTSKEWNKYVKIVFLLVIGIEAIGFSSITLNRRNAYSKKEFQQRAGGFNDNTKDAISFLKITEKSFYRVEKDYTSGNALHGSLNDAQVQGYFGTANYASFNQQYYIHFFEETGVIEKGVETQTRWAPGLRTRPLLQTLVGVKYNLSKSEKPFVLNVGYKTIQKFGDVTLLKNEYELPLGFTYKQFITLSNFQKLTSELQKDLALLRAFVIPDEKRDIIKTQFKEITNADSVVNFGFPLYKQFTDSLKKESLKMTSFKQNKIKGKIELSEPKMLFFSIPYDIGWTALVDGKKVQAELINIGFLGLTLQKGSHEIEISYLPPYFSYAVLLTIISSLLFVGLFFYLVEIKTKYKFGLLGGLLISYLLWILIYY